MLIKCHECQREISDAAPACPHCGAPKVADNPFAKLPSYHVGRSQKTDASPKLPSPMPVIFGVAVGCVAVLAVTGAIVASLVPTPPRAAAKAGVTNQAAAVPTDIVHEGPPLVISNWSYDTSPDPMQKSPMKTACTSSTNEVRMTFPYHDTDGELCIRDWPGHGLSSYVQLSGDGQILCGIESCAVHMRFDDGSVQTFPGVGAADNSTNILFIRKTPGLIAALKRSKTTTVELTLYDNGVQALSFDTHGLSWPPA